MLFVWFPLSFGLQVCLGRECLSSQDFFQLVRGQKGGIFGLNQRGFTRFHGIGQDWMLQVFDSPCHHLSSQDVDDVREGSAKYTPSSKNDIGLFGRLHPYSFETFGHRGVFFWGGQVAITRVQRPQIAAQVLGLWLMTDFLKKQGWTFSQLRGQNDVDHGSFF